ncbi:MAG: Rab family GTPase [Candidatus Thorarchaeota archaeon]
MKSAQTTDHIFKVCVTGDAAVGKSSAIRKWVTDGFDTEYQVTVGVQHYTKYVDLSGSGIDSTVKLIIWDLGGQQTFSFIRPLFYRAARGVIVMFDLGNRGSFDSLNNWIREAEVNVGRRVPMVVAGNKADLERYEVDVAEAREFSRTLGLPFLLTSAKAGMNVPDLFITLAIMILQESTKCSGPVNPGAACMLA